MTVDHSAHASHHHIAPGFGADRAAHYDAQASVSLAGVQAAYELGVSALTAELGKDPVLTNVELRRWRAYGIPLAELESRRQRFAVMRPLESDASLFELLARTGLVAPRALFVALQYKVFLARFEP
jgi:hypothetical protein